MPRHHNRAILSEITEKQLDPNKEYVAGKHGLTLSLNEKKKERNESGNESTISVPEVVVTKISNEQALKEESVKQPLSSKDEDKQEAQTPTVVESTPLVSSETEDSSEQESKLETNGEKDNKKKKVNKPKL
jgi:hypothetical protein